MSSYDKIGRCDVELSQSGHGGSQLGFTWRDVIIGLAGHPGGEFPQISGELNERFAFAGRNRYWHDGDTVLGRVPEHLVNEPQAVRCRMLLRPAPQYHLLPPRRAYPPKLGPAKSTGCAERSNLQRLAVPRIAIQNGLYVHHEQQTGVLFESANEPLADFMPRGTLPVVESAKNGVYSRGLFCAFPLALPPLRF